MFASCMYVCMYVCMDSLCRCIVAWGTLRELSTGRRTVTMAAPLLLTSGPVRYEIVLHGCGTSPMGVVVYVLATSKVGY